MPEPVLPQVAELPLTESAPAVRSLVAAAFRYQAVALLERTTRP